jgi:hypothetical protein
VKRKLGKYCPFGRAWLPVAVLENRVFERKFEFIGHGGYLNFIGKRGATPVRLFSKAGIKDFSKNNACKAAIGPISSTLF